MADTAEAKKILQAEVMAVKQRWPDDIKLTKAKSDAPKAPLPIAIQRTIVTPADASAWDVTELKIKLWIDDLDSSTLPVRVEVDPTDLPSVLVAKMSERILEQWRTELRARGGGNGWLLEKVLGWCESKFVDLLSLDPRGLDMYQGSDENGMTIRRYGLQDPPPEVAPAAAEEEEESEEEEEESDEDEDPEVRKERERLERIRIKAEEEADRLWREERRKEAEELGEDYKEKVVSKKEQQAAIKAKQEKRQGVRTRKEGAKHNKFDAEAAGKKKNNKNGLIT